MCVIVILITSLRTKPKDLNNQIIIYRHPERSVQSSWAQPKDLKRKQQTEQNKQKRPSTL